MCESMRAREKSVENNRNTYSSLMLPCAAIAVKGRHVLYIFNSNFRKMSRAVEQKFKLTYACSKCITFSNWKEKPLKRATAVKKKKTKKPTETGCQRLSDYLVDGLRAAQFKSGYKYIFTLFHFLQEKKLSVSSLPSQFHKHTVDCMQVSFQVSNDPCSSGSLIWQVNILVVQT